VTGERRRARGAWAAGLAAGAAALGLLAGSPARAGIVVLRNGEVLVGRLAASDVSEAGVTLRWPHGARTDRGRLFLPAERVRWFDPEADTLSDAYFEAHGDAPLQGARWRRLQEERRARQASVDDAEVDLVPESALVTDVLDWIPTPGDGFTIRKPRGWTAEEQEGLLVLRGPAQGGRRAPRIHVLAAPRDDTLPPGDQVALILRALGGLPGTSVEVVEQGRLRAAGAGGADQTLLTDTRVSGRTVRTLRELRFRRARTYLFCAYAEAADFPRLEETLRAALASWELSPGGR